MLYLKAVEQLGADKAAIRHGGLYALERLAQDNLKLRQTVTEVICAYLRAPFVPVISEAPRLGMRASARTPPRGHSLQAGMAGRVPSHHGRQQG